MTKIVKASEFKAKCLRLMDDVAADGETIVVTKNGTPIVRISPVRDKPRTLYGVMKDTFVHIGDVETPLDVEWDAMK